MKLVNRKKVLEDSMEGIYWFTLWSVVNTESSEGPWWESMRIPMLEIRAALRIDRGFMV